METVEKGVKYVQSQQKKTKKNYQNDVTDVGLVLFQVTPERSH